MRRPGNTLKLILFIVAPMVLCVACMPLPRRTTKVVVAKRVEPDGTPIEILQQEMTSKRTFYLIAPDGPVTERWPFRFNYTLIDTNGRRKDLAFLTKKEVQADWLLGFPISQGRWVAVTVPAQRRVDRRASEVDWQVFVFQRENVLLSRSVTLELDPALGELWIREPFPGSPAWKPLTGGVAYRTRLLRFDPTNECLTFTTFTGDLLFNPNDGTLRKINGS